MLLGKAKTLHWTFHSRAKMRHWGLSEARVKRILHAPTRTEEGIAPKTMAIMQKAGSVKHPCELWVMVEDKRSVRNVISAWRYPGATKPRSGTALDLMRDAYQSYLSEAVKEMEKEAEKKEAKKEEFRRKFGKSKWFKEKT